MSVKPLFAPVTLDNRAILSGGQQPETIRVPLGTDEQLSPKQFLERAVMIALGTADVKRADEFLRQSGLERHVLPAPQKNGEGAFLPFAADAKFWKSIENFKQTGAALPLAEAKKQSVATPPDPIQKTGGRMVQSIAAEAKTSSPTTSRRTPASI